MESSYGAKVVLPSLSQYGVFVTPLIAYADNQSVEVATVRGLGKIGLAFTYPRIDFGLTLTTASIPLYGNTTVQRDELFSYINSDDNNYSEYIAGANSWTELILATDSFLFELNQNTFTLSDRQSSGTDQIKATYKSPFSIGAGVVFKSRKLDLKNHPIQKVYLSFECFGGISPYYLIEPEERGVIRPLRDNYPYTSTSFLGIVECPQSVINIALGYEYILTKKLTLLTSFRTNGSYADLNNIYSEMNLSLTYWDIWHFSIGGVYERKSSDISVGLSYSDGYGIQYPYIVMTDASESNYLAGEDYQTNSVFKSFGVSIGYNYYSKTTD